MAGNAVWAHIGTGALSVLNSVLYAKLIALGLHAPMQAAFCANYRVEDNSVLLHTVFEQLALTCTPVYFLYVDLRKAYDIIDRGQLWDILGTALPSEPGLVKAVQGLYYALKAKLAEDPSLPAIKVNIGVKQGCLVSPQMFQIYFDHVYAHIE